MRVFGGEVGEVLKNALCFVKSAKRGRRKVCVLFDLRAKDAKKWKGASFFAMHGLSEVESGRIVEMGNWELEGKARDGMERRGQGLGDGERCG
jgi:hypothetical protein